MYLMTIASQNNICWILFLMFLSLFNRKNNIWRIFISKLICKHQLHLLSDLCLKYNGIPFLLVGQVHDYLGQRVAHTYVDHVV